MKIQKMFAKDINRNITGVIKVGQIEEKNKEEELREYVVTRELSKHFREFFSHYSASIKSPTDEMGVWISGFFGSGKSHFLKILSYILDNTKVDGKYAVEYFRDKDNISSDQITMADMELASHTPTQAILFNVDSKATATGKSDSNAIVLVFNRAFNEKRGYCGAIPHVADLEKELDETGKYQKFQEAFEKIYGHSWLDSRHKFRLIKDKVKQAIVESGAMDEEAATSWAMGATDSYDIAIADFAKEVEDYIEKTGERVVFLVDEIGQFIGGDESLMLNLQTMTEELGARCKGKAWVIITAQESLDSMSDDMKKNEDEYSKIQARFRTRLSLTSVNADEVIRERILKKNEAGQKTLEALYATDETDITNAVEFVGATEMKKIESAEQFAAVYPFLPYQSKLLGDVLNSIRLNSASGRNLSEGERSMLGAYQQAAIAVEDKEDGVLVPFYRFYDDLVKFLDHTHAGVIQRAEDNERLNPNHDSDCFTVDVLKTLFLLKYVQGVPMTINNIRSLMMTSIHEDKVGLQERIIESLHKLIDELLVQQVQDTYEFLTDEEQDINREIEHRNVQQTDVIAAVTDMVYDQIYNITRYRVAKNNGRYTFAFNQAVDKRPRRNVQNNEIGIRLITPYYFGGPGGQLDDTTMCMISSTQREAILLLPSDKTAYLKDMSNALKIDDYMRNVADPRKGKSTIIRSTKMEESASAKESAGRALREAIGEASIFVNGIKVTDIRTSDAQSRMNEALGRLVDNIYFKLSYLESPKDDVDIKELFKKQDQVSFNVGNQGEANAHALQEVRTFVSLSSDKHNMVSMKAIIDQFSRAPYGYLDSDIRWLAAKLFKDGEISATVDREPITTFNREPIDLGGYFTGRSYLEKLLFRIHETISPAKVRDVREVLHELFRVSEVTEDVDKLMASFKDRSVKMLEKCRDMLTENRVTPQFPGADILQNAVRRLEEIGSIMDPTAFYDKVSEDKDDLLDLAEDIQPVITFYGNDSQKTIFRNDGLRALDLYDNSKEYTPDQNLKEIITKIKTIVNNKNPYSQIKDLPGLYEEFSAIYGKILDAKMEPVKQVIDGDMKKILSKIEGTELEEEYKAKVTSAFMDLMNRADSTGDISVMLGFKDRADSLCEIYLNEINNKLADIAFRKAKEEAERARKAAEKAAKAGGVSGEGTDYVYPTEGGSVEPGQLAENPLGVPPVVRAKPNKTVLARSLTREWRIETKDDLDNYLESLRKLIESQMDDEHTITISF